MQISRHWRMNSQRYRLEGVRYQNGEVSLQLRPTPRTEDDSREAASKMSVELRVPTAVGR